MKSHQLKVLSFVLLIFSLTFYPHALFSSLPAETLALGNPVPSPVIKPILVNYASLDGPPSAEILKRLEITRDQLLRRAAERSLEVISDMPASGAFKEAVERQATTARGEGETSFEEESLSPQSSVGQPSSLFESAESDLPPLIDIPSSSTEERTDFSFLRAMDSTGQLYDRNWSRPLVNRHLTVLSLDGGGINGYLTALTLDKIEQKTGYPIARLFPLMGGTSIGGLIAILLSTRDPKDPLKPKFSARDVVRLFEEESSSIFSRSFWHKLKTLGGIKGPKYKRDGIDRVAETYLGTARLRDTLPYTDILIPTYDLTAKDTVFIKSSRARINSQKDWAAADVARATSAAPTFWDPAIISGRGYIDGGVFANTPAPYVLAEASHLYREVSKKDIRLVSIGTRGNSDIFNHEEFKGRGPIGWINPLLDCMFDGMKKAANYLVAQQLAAGPREEQRYFHFEPQDHGSSLDDYSPENMLRLRVAAERMCRTREFEVMCDMLKRNCESRGKAGRGLALVAPKSASAPVSRSISPLSHNDNEIPLSEEGMKGRRRSVSLSTLAEKIEF